MPTLYNPAYGDVVKENFLWIYVDDDFPVEKGDVVCIEKDCQPHLVGGDSLNGHGFTIGGYTGRTMGFIKNCAEFEGFPHETKVSLWRRLEGFPVMAGQQQKPPAAYKRPYKPSVWAEPVPLP